MTGELSKCCAVTWKHFDQLDWKHGWHMHYTCTWWPESRWCPSLTLTLSCYIFYASLLSEVRAGPSVLAASQAKKTVTWQSQGYLQTAAWPGDWRQQEALLCHDVSQVRSIFMECLGERKCCAMFLHAHRHQRMWINTTNAPLFTQRFKSANHFRVKRTHCNKDHQKIIYSQQKTGCY